MFDNDKRENLANARRKLKKFRDQQQQSNGNEYTNLPATNNGSDPSSVNGVLDPSSIVQPSSPEKRASFVNEQQAILNGIYQNLSKSPVTEFEEQNRQYALLIENQKQQRARLEDQRQSAAESSMSGRSSRSQFDVDATRNQEQKYRRDMEHLQEQLEIHVQTIGILVAEKTDVSAKLSQSFKQLERKQSEMDELQGRLKASRERVQELEKEMQNSTSSVQKREMAAKESDKENDRLKIENIRQSQLVEDLKGNINQLNEKLRQQANTVEQLTGEMDQLKKHPQPTDEKALLVQTYEQQINELKQTIGLNSMPTDELRSTIERMRSENEQLQYQYQEYNSQMQNYIEQLNSQMDQLSQDNAMLRTEHEAMRTAHQSRVSTMPSFETSDQSDLQSVCDRLQQENQLFQNAIDQWSQRYEEVRTEKEHLAKVIQEKEQRGVELQANIKSERTDSSSQEENERLKSHLKHVEEELIRMTDEQRKLTDQIQTLEDSNMRLNESLANQTSTNLNQQSNDSFTTDTSSQDHSFTANQATGLSPTSTDLTDEQGSKQKIIERFNRAMHENADLKDRIQQLEHVILQLQSETETIGDYIYLYQQQREQLQRRYHEKDDYIKQLTHDRCNLQRKLSELEILLIRSLNPPSNDEQQDANTNGAALPSDIRSSMQQPPSGIDEHGSAQESDVVHSELKDVTMAAVPTKLPQLDDDTKARILTLIRELGRSDLSLSSSSSSPYTFGSSTTKLAFVDKNLYICSTCSGPVQWV